MELFQLYRKRVHAAPGGLINFHGNDRKDLFLEATEWNRTLFLSMYRAVFYTVVYISNNDVFFFFLLYRKRAQDERKTN